MVPSKVRKGRPCFTIGNAGRLGSGSSNSAADLFGVAESESKGRGTSNAFAICDEFGGTVATDATSTGSALSVGAGPVGVL